VPDTGKANVTTLTAALSALLAALPEVAGLDSSGVTAKERQVLRARIEDALGRLRRVQTALDPIRLPSVVLDPSDPEVVGRLIAETLLVQERRALAGIPKFYGSGVYALYYSGGFDAYQPLVGTQTPIYVGKADPAKHGATTPEQQGTKVWDRLNEHRKSITAAQNLEVHDFECRYLVVRSAWQNTAETYLISRFSPIWNNEVKICYEFGKHGDDPATRSNQRSPWDTLHPGRAWALKSGNQPYSKTVDEIRRQIAEHFAAKPPS
jgi:hypothetical protein